MARGGGARVRLVPTRQRVPLPQDVTPTPYAGAVRRRFVVREDEVRIVTVTPVSRGVARPAWLTLALGASVRYAADSFRVVAHHQVLIGLVVVGPVAVVTLTRVWRWRTHKIHVTSQRVVAEGGVFRHVRVGVELRDVVAVRTTRGLGDRLTARGDVILETLAGPWVVGRVRHPAALVRLIEGERLERAAPSWAYDAVIDPPRTVSDVGARYRTT